MPSRCQTWRLFQFTAPHGAKRRAARPRKAVYMADKEEVDVIAEESPHGDETDYKAMYEKAVAESRKWESRSKANAEKAKRYDELESANKTLEERVSSIEAANRALEDEKARSALVKQVAKATGVPESIVSTLSATDEESMTAQAAAIAEAYKVPGGAPNAPEAGKFPKGKEQEAAGVDEKRQFVRDLLGKR